MQKSHKVWRQWKKQIVCITAGVLMYGLAAMAGKSGGSLSEGYLERGGYGDEPIVYDFVVEGLGEEPLDCQVEIHPVQYGEEEVEQVFDQIISRIPDMIRGENESVSAVRIDLELPSDFPEYGVQIS